MGKFHTGGNLWRLALGHSGRCETRFLIAFLAVLNSGRVKTKIAITLMVPAMGRLKNIAKDPLEMIKDCRMDASANGPNTMARTTGAMG